jgi:hypothetical protein
MFFVPPLEPGQSVTRNATVASTGPAASVRLFGEVSGTGLARFLTIRVTRDTGRTDALAPAGGGTAPTVVFRGRMRAFPRGWEDGLDVGDARTSRHLQTFRFEITLADDPRAQGADRRD